MYLTESWLGVWSRDASSENSCLLQHSEGGGSKFTVAFKQTTISLGEKRRVWIIDLRVRLQSPGLQCRNIHKLGKKEGGGLGRGSVILQSLHSDLILFRHSWKCLRTSLLNCLPTHMHAYMHACVLTFKGGSCQVEKNAFVARWTTDMRFIRGILYYLAYSNIHY